MPRVIGRLRQGGVRSEVNEATRHTNSPQCSGSHRSTCLIENRQFGVGDFRRTGGRGNVTMRNTGGNYRTGVP